MLDGKTNSLRKTINDWPECNLLVTPILAFLPRKKIFPVRIVTIVLFPDGKWRVRRRSRDAIAAEVEIQFCTVMSARVSDLTSNTGPCKF